MMGSSVLYIWLTATFFSLTVIGPRKIYTPQTVILAMGMAAFITAWVYLVQAWLILVYDLICDLMKYI